MSHKMLKIGCAWSKGSGERLQGHHGHLVTNVMVLNKRISLSACCLSFCCPLSHTHTHTHTHTHIRTYTCTKIHSQIYQLLRSMLENGSYQIRSEPKKKSCVPPMVVIILVLHPSNFTRMFASTLYGTVPPITTLGKTAQCRQ